MANILFRITSLPFNRKIARERIIATDPRRWLINIFAVYKFQISINNDTYEFSILHFALMSYAHVNMLFRNFRKNLTGTPSHETWLIPILKSWLVERLWNRPVDEPAIDLTDQAFLNVVLNSFPIAAVRAGVNIDRGEIDRMAIDGNRNEFDGWHGFVLLVLAFLDQVQMQPGEKERGAMHGGKAPLECDGSDTQLEWGDWMRSLFRNRSGDPPGHRSILNLEVFRPIPPWKNNQK